MGLSNICSQQIHINLICISYTYSSHEYQSNFILILIYCYSHNNNRLGTFRIINNIIQGHYYIINMQIIIIKILINSQNTISIQQAQSTIINTIHPVQFQISHQWSYPLGSAPLSHIYSPMFIQFIPCLISHFHILSHFITYAHHISITTTYSIHKPTIHIMYILNSYHITNSCQITHNFIFYIYSKELTYIFLY